jgi:hypothetical protein
MHMPLHCTGTASSAVLTAVMQHGQMKNDTSCQIKKKVPAYFHYEVLFVGSYFSFVQWY